MAAGKQIEIDLALNRISKKSINWSHLLWDESYVTHSQSRFIECLLLPRLSRNKIKRNNVVTVNIFQQALVLKIVPKKSLVQIPGSHP